LLLAIIGFALAALTAGQALHVLVTGEELCVGQGCAVVARLTRISPALFNFLGTAAFGATALLALLARRVGGRALPALLHVFLTALLAAEGVLFAYQWHVAGAWCVYCLVILGGVAALNLLLGPARALFGFAAFAATLTIFSLLTFLPAQADLNRGTMAVRTGSGEGDFFLVFSENCPHCQRVVEAIRKNDACTVRLNPVAPMPASFWSDLKRASEYDPGVNIAVARMLGLQTIPIVIARVPGGLQVITGEDAILRFVDASCRTVPTRDVLLAPWGSGSILGPAEEGCGLNVNCN
jgi:hypothetical protein